MSLANELSGEVAVALFLVYDRSPQDLNKLAEIVMSVSAAFQKMERGEQSRRLVRISERARRVSQMMSQPS